MATKAQMVEALLSDPPSTFRAALTQEDVQLSEVVDVRFEFERGGAGSQQLRAVALRDIQNRVFKVTASYGLAALVSCKGTRERWRVYGTFVDKMKVDEMFDIEADARQRMTDLMSVHYGTGTTLYCDRIEAEID
jgi:hypothetical protein